MERVVYDIKIVKWDYQENGITNLFKMSVYLNNDLVEVKIDYIHNLFLRCQYYNGGIPTELNCTCQSSQYMHVPSH